MDEELLAGMWMTQKQLHHLEHACNLAWVTSHTWMNVHLPDYLLILRRSK